MLSCNLQLMGLTSSFECSLDIWNSFGSTRTERYLNLMDFIGAFCHLLLNRFHLRNCLSRNAVVQCRSVWCNCMTKCRKSYFDVGWKERSFFFQEQPSLRSLVHHGLCFSLSVLFTRSHTELYIFISVHFEKEKLPWYYCAFWGWCVCDVLDGNTTVL